MTTQHRTDSAENVARRPPPILALMVLAGSTLPLTAFSCSQLLDLEIFVTPMTGIEIANLVIVILQLGMQIAQFIFVIEQLFLWKGPSPP